MLSFRKNSSTGDLKDLLEGYAAVDCSTSLGSVRNEIGLGKCAMNSHSTFTPRCVDELIALARVLPNLLDSTCTTALNGHSHFRLPYNENIGRISDDSANV